MAGIWLSRVALEKLQREHTDIHRIYSASDLWIERFAGDFLISYKNRESAERLASEAQDWGRQNGLVVERIFLKALQKNPRESYRAELFFGWHEKTKRNVAHELGLAYQLDFLAGYSCGFFLDQRANRAFLRKLKPARVLNLFAYTCSFSVVAASGGAQTCSVDVSKRALDWGRENFQQNGLALDRHRFFTDDARDVVRRLRKRGESFDLIILDPPTFARNRDGKCFRVERDFSPLLTDLLSLTEGGAHLLLSTNFENWHVENLRELGKTAAEQASRPVTFFAAPPLPDIPPGQSAKTLWMKLT